jgi:chemotaxis protein MotB
MSKKKHPEHVNHERWLVSYADFITLLFAFFVVLFASGQTDKRKQLALAHSIQSAFDHNGIFDPHSRIPPISEDPNGIEHAVALPVALPLPRVAQPETPSMAKITANRVRQAIEAQVARKHLAEGAISVRSSPDGLIVSLHDAGFFASGSAEVSEESLDALKAIAATLPMQPMRVEGHTDNVPIHTAQYATNWELSTARAAAIARLLIDDKAADPALLSAAGYAEFRPIATNETAEGRAKNRRVDIVLLSEPTTPQPPGSSQ